METADNETRPKGSNRHCFLCWIKLEEPEAEDSGGPSDHHHHPDPQPLQYLFSYLKLEMTRKKGTSSASDQNSTRPRENFANGSGANWRIRFCEGCLPIQETFVELYGQLQQIQLEMANCLQRIDWKVGNGASEGSRETTHVHDGNERDDDMIGTIGLRQEIRQKCCQKLCNLLADQVGEDAEWAKEEAPKLDSPPPRSVTLTIRRVPIPNSSPAPAPSSKVKTEPLGENYEGQEEDSDSYVGANNPDDEDFWSGDLVEANYQNQTGASNVKTDEMPELDPLRDDDTMDIMNELMQQPSTSTNYDSSSPHSVTIPNDEEEEDINSNPPIIIYPPQTNPELTRKPRFSTDPVTGLLNCFCGKGFRHNNSLRCHYNSVHLQIRYRCRLCQKDYTKPYYYKLHNESDHLRGRLLTCKYCNKGFTLQSKLTKHVQNAHSKPMAQKQKPVQCQHCRETYTNSMNLHKHMKTCPVLNPHRSNRSFECDICHQKFLSFRLRTDHQRAKHFPNIFGCDRCHQTFTSRTYKYKHKCTYSKRVKKERMDPLTS